MAMKKPTQITLAILILLAVIIAGVIHHFSGQDDGNTIKIGAVLPLTGAGAEFAEYIQQGMDMAVAELQGKGLGITVMYQDSASNPRDGINAYRKIMSDSPQAVVIALSSVARALAPYAKEGKTLQMYTAVAIPDVTDGQTRFRIYPEANGMAGVMARYNAKSLNAKTSAVIYINDDFGRASLECYQNVFKQHGGTVVHASSYELLQKEYRDQLVKLNSMQPAPDVIYVCGYGPAYGAILKGIRELGISSQLTADMSMGVPSMLAQVGRDAAEGVYYVDGEMSPNFAEAFEKSYDRPSSSYAGYAYDAVHLLAEAFREGRTNQATAAQRLQEIDDYNGAMGAIRFEPDGESNLSFTVNQIRNGSSETVQNKGITQD